MCGIAGIAGIDNVTERLVDAIQNLEYRGYDSCGVAIVSDGKKSRISIKKNIGGVEEVSTLERFTTLKGKTGIAHTRWATHGGVTKENAHPHQSCDKRFSAAHNGIISNYTALRKSLIKEGHKFISETDTETIVHLMEKFYGQYKDVEKAFLSMLGRLEGTYAILLISTEEPDRIYCARKESPLIIGKGNGSNYIGSDFNAFISHTKDAVIMEDGEYAIVTAKSFVHKNITTGKQIKRSVTQITWDPEMAQKGGFPHFMLKEMYDQPKVVTNALDIDKDSIRDLAKVMSGKKKIY